MKLRMPGFIRIFIRGIKNLWVYRKIIWNTGEWDQHYLLEFMRFKINRMIKSFETAQYYEGFEKDITWMKRASYILKRLMDDDYQIPNYDKLMKEAYPENYRYSDDLPESNRLKAWKIVSANAKYYKIMRNQDYQYLCKIIKNQLDKWWW